MITMKFRPLYQTNLKYYYVRFARESFHDKYTIWLHIDRAMQELRLTKLDAMSAMPGQQLNPINVTYTCPPCSLDGIFLRAADGSVRDLEHNKYHQRNEHKEKAIEFKLGTVKPSDFGDYFLIMRNDNNTEERIKVISIKVISLECTRMAATVGKPVDISTTYKFVNASCELVDVLCHLDSVLASGCVKHNASSKHISLNFTSFEDQDACVYLAIFKIGDDLYRKNFAIIENVELVPLRVEPPAIFTPFERTIEYKCTRPDCRCRLINVTLNSLTLEATTRRPSIGSVAYSYYMLGDSSVTIGITNYSWLFEGVFQGVFMLGADQVTKTLLEIGPDAAKPMHDSENQINVPETESQAEAAAEGAVVGQKVSESGEEY